MNPRILLLGRNGQLGFALAKAGWLAGRGIALARHECDLTDEASIRRAVRETAPGIVINAAAYTAVDKAEDEPEIAHAVNARAPEVLAEETRTANAALVHFSTDYVFDGTKDGAWVETDPVAPVSVYGRSKLAGEQAIAASGCRHIILRTAWVYSTHGQNFARTMLRLALERDSLSVVGDQWGTPTPVDLLRDVTQIIVDKLHTSGGDAPSGLFHCSASGRTNWRDYAAFFLSCCAEAGARLKLDPNGIAAIDSSQYPTKARRPKNSLLSCAKLEQTLDMKMPDWRIGVRDLAKQLGKMA